MRSDKGEDGESPESKRSWFNTSNPLTYLVVLVLAGVLTSLIVALGDFDSDDSPGGGETSAAPTVSLSAATTTSVAWSTTSLVSPSGPPRGIPLGSLDGVPPTTPTAIVSGVAHPGAVEWRLAHSACPGRSELTTAPLGGDLERLVATFALADETPADALVRVVVRSTGAEREQQVVLGPDARSEVVNVDDVAGELEIEITTLSSPSVEQSSCAAVPIVVVAFDTVLT